MCQPLHSVFLPLCWWQRYLAGLATAWASSLSAADGSSSRQLARTPLLKLHVSQLRLNPAAETARIAAAAESRRAVAAQQARDRVAARVKVIEREYAALPAACEFAGDELRLLQRERATYLDAGPGAVPNALPADAGDPAQRAPNGAQPHGVGVGLPGPSGGVHRLDREQ